MQPVVSADLQPPLTRWGNVWRYVAAALISVASFAGAADRDSGVSAGRAAVDIGLGALAFGLVTARRRYPLPIALVISAFTALSASSGGPAALAVTSMATRRDRTQMAWVAAVNLAAAGVFQAVSPRGDGPWYGEMLGSLFFVAALLGWGQFVGSRRELLWNLQQRAERAEAEQDLRAGEARANERTRIAREMHDVVAHRISHVSMRAGAMAFRDDLSVEQMRAESGLIRDAANEALRELRSVLHVLRDPTTGELVEQPQPTYADLAALISRARADGMRIDLDDDLRAAPPGDIGRTIYRIVQEGITNASKHAPGARLRISLRDDGDNAVNLIMTNPLGFERGQTPGSGLGLIGIAERVQVAGGRFSHRVDDGEFVVEAWFPCRP